MVTGSDDIFEYSISSFYELRNFILEFPPSYSHGGWLYRGQSNHLWPLIPKAGRAPFKDTKFYMHRFSQWCKEAIAYDQRFPENEWEQLALAQHHGLATNLLDWSGNPLVAAFFACEDKNEDGVIYCYFPTQYITEPINQPMKDIDEIVGYIPQHFTTRIIKQSGYFTFHPFSQMEINQSFLEHPFQGQKLKKIIINNRHKEEIINEINIYGINRKTLFPDLDGLSAYINWVTLQRNKEAE